MPHRPNGLSCVCYSVALISTSLGMARHARAATESARHPMPCLTSSCEMALPTEALIDSIGVNVPISADRYFAPMLPLMRNLGVRHVRVGMFTNATQYQFYKNLAASHIYGTIIDSFGATARDIRIQIKTLGTKNSGGFIETMEGVNEPNNPAMPWYTSNWVKAIRDQQSVLWVTTKDTSPSLTVLGPSICCNSRDQALLGDLSILMDSGNIHDYFGSSNPGLLYYSGMGSIRQQLNTQSVISKWKPITSTETGWGSSPKDPAAGVDPVIQGRYIIRNFFLQKSAGVSRVYDFNLLDQGVSTVPYGSYGIVGIEPDGSMQPKPAYYALKNLIAELRDDGKSFYPSGLSYRLTGDCAGVEHLLLQKRDGSFLLALWVEVASWDASNQKDFVRPPQKVIISSSVDLAAAEAVSITGSTYTNEWVKLRLHHNVLEASATDEVQLIHLIPTYQVDKISPLQHDESPGFSWIRNVNSDLCMFVVNALVTPGQRVSQRPCREFKNQQFIIAKLPGEVITIVDVNSRNCLTSEGKAPGRLLVTANGCDRRDRSERFHLQSAGGNRYSLRSEPEGLCVDVPGESRESDAQMQLQTCNGRPSQTWLIPAAASVLSTKAKP